MYIAPNTDIRLLHDVALEPTYRYTLWFDYFDSTKGKADQYTYFTGQTYRVFDKCSFQREKRAMRLEINIEEARKCNYLMYRNTSYGDMWFYAFIDGYTYIDNGCTEIAFSIDYMQTYYWSWHHAACWVERAHTETDDVGQWTQVEPVTLGYMVQELAHMHNFPTYGVIILTAFDNILDSTPAKGRIYAGIYSGIGVQAYDINAIDTINDFLSEVTSQNKTESIIDIYMYPTELFTVGEIPKILTEQVAKPATLGAYKPRNNKLLTYPYNYLKFGCQYGSSRNLRYEFFDGANCEFYITGTCIGTPIIACTPNNYANMNHNANDNGLYITKFPKCAYAIDSYRAYLAQNFGANALSLLSSATDSMMNFYSANPFTKYSAGTSLAAGAKGIAGQLGDLAIENYNAWIQPDRVKGEQGSDLGVAMRDGGFYFAQEHISEEYARYIDSFFDLYGYAQNEVRVPWYHYRPHWNYIKTRGCTINGSIPAEAETRICQMYDDGITFWKNPAEVNDYSLDNRPEGG